MGVRSAKASAGSGAVRRCFGFFFLFCCGFAAGDRLCEEGKGKVSVGPKRHNYHRGVFFFFCVCDYRVYVCVCVFAFVTPKKTSTPPFSSCRDSFAPFFSGKLFSLETNKPIKKKTPAPNECALIDERGGGELCTLRCLHGALAGPALGDVPRCARVWTKISQRRGDTRLASTGKQSSIPKWQRNEEMKPAGVGEGGGGLVTLIHR